MKTGTLRFSPVSRSIAARNVRRSLLTSSRPLTRYEPACVTMISSLSLGGAAGTSEATCGSCKLILVSCMKVVETMRNSTRTSSTSTSEMTLISGSSLERFCSFIDHSKYAGLTGPLLIMQHRLDEAHRLLFDPHDQSLDAPAQITVRNQRRNRDRQTRGRGDQRFRDAAREHSRVRYAVGRDGRERANHARHGAEQTEQRRDGGNRAERAQVALELVDDVASRVFDDFFEHVTRGVPIREPGGEHLPERRALLNFLDLFGVELVALDELHYVIRDAHRHYALLLQRPQPFENYRDRHHRARDDRPHEPTTRLDDLEH